MQTLALAVTQYGNLQGGGTLTSPGLLKLVLDEQAERAAKYISGHFGEFVNSPGFDTDPVFGAWSKNQRDAVRDIVRLHPSVGAAELADIDAVVKPALRAQGEQAWMMPYLMVPVCLFSGLLFVCVTQFLSLSIFCSTLGQRLFGFAVVNELGKPAGRLRMLGRWIVAWALVILFVTLFASGQMRGGFGGGIGMVLIGGWLLWFAGIAVAVARPESGPHDRIAGTRLVPR